MSKVLDLNLSLNNSCLIKPKKCGNPNCFKALTNSSDLVPISSYSLTSTSEKVIFFVSILTKLLKDIIPKVESGQ